jgi:hypothetical protein
LKKKFDFPSPLWVTINQDENKNTLKQTLYNTLSVVSVFLLASVIFFQNLNKSNLDSEMKHRILRTTFTFLYDTPFLGISVSENTEHLTSVFSDLVIYLNILL